MLNLNLYKQYWQQMPDKVPFISGVLFSAAPNAAVARAQRMTCSDSPILWVLVPQSVGVGDTIDEYGEEMACVVFLLAKFDPQRQNDYDAVAQMQPTIEQIREQMIDDITAGCPVLQGFEPRSVSIMPEFAVSATLVGWSIGFRIGKV